MNTYNVSPLILSSTFSIDIHWAFVIVIFNWCIVSFLYKVRLLYKQKQYNQN